MRRLLCLSVLLVLALSAARAEEEAKRDPRPGSGRPTGQLPTMGISHLDVERIEDRDAGRLEKLGALGRVWVKTVPIVWGRVQPKPTQGVMTHYEWKDIDKAVLLWQLAGFEPVPVLSPRCTWAGQPIDKTSWAKLIARELDAHAAEVTLRTGLGVAPPRLSRWVDWERFVEAFVERYDHDGIQDMPGLRRPIRYIQIMDRVALPSSWLGSADEYMRLLHHTDLAVSRAAPKTQVVHAAIDLGVTGHAPMPQDDAAWLFRVGQQLPATPPAARLEAKRRFAFIQRTLEMPRLFDVMAHVGSHNIQDDVANIRFLRALLDRNEGKDKSIWLVDNPVTKIAGSRVPRSLRPSKAEARLRKRWLPVARFKSHGDHAKVMNWIQTGQAFDLIRSYCRSRAAGADAVLFFPRPDQVPEAPLRPADHPGIPPALIRSADNGTAVAHTPGPLWYAWRQFWKHTRDHSAVDQVKISAPGRAIVFEVPEKRRHAFVVVVLLDSHLSWAGTPGKPMRKRKVALTLPRGRYAIEQIDLGGPQPARREANVADGLLMLDVGPAPVYVIPLD